MAHLAQDAKTKRQGFAGFVSKHTPALGESSPGELTIDCDGFLIASAAAHLLRLPAAIPSCTSSTPSCGAENHRVTLPLHSCRPHCLSGSLHYGILTISRSGI